MGYDHIPVKNTLHEVFKSWKSLLAYLYNQAQKSG